MKQLNKISGRDWSLIAIIGFFAFVIGWSFHALFTDKKEIMIENPVNKSLVKKSDSLELLVTIRDSIIRENEKKYAISDSILINNNKALKKEYETIKNMDFDAKLHYVDSILKKSNRR